MSKNTAQLRDGYASLPERQELAPVGPSQSQGVEKLQFDTKISERENHSVRSMAGLTPHSTRMPFSLGSQSISPSRLSNP